VFIASIAAAMQTVFVAGNSPH